MMSISIFSRSIWWDGKHSAQMIQFSVDCIICRSPNRNDKSQQNEKRVKILYHPDSTGYLEEDRAIQAIWWLEDQPTDEPCSTRFFRDRRVALQESWSSSDLWDRSGFMSANEDSQKVTVMPSTQLQRRLDLMINGFVVHGGFKGYQKGGSDGVGDLSEVNSWTAWMVLVTNALIEVLVCEVISSKRAWSSSDNRTVSAFLPFCFPMSPTKTILVNPIPFPSENDTN